MATNLGVSLSNHDRSPGEFKMRRITRLATFLSGPFPIYSFKTSSFYDQISRRSLSFLVFRVRAYSDLRVAGLLIYDNLLDDFASVISKCIDGLSPEFAFVQDAVFFRHKLIEVLPRISNVRSLPRLNRRLCQGLCRD